MGLTEDMPLDLLVPRLLPPADAPPEMASLRLPALERALAASTLAVAPVTGSHAWLAAEHGISGPAPVAAVSLAAERGERPEGTWLRADPVHIRIDRESIRLHGPAVLEIGPAEADALVEALRRHFREDGLSFEAVAPDRWYVNAPASEAPRTTPLAHVVGRAIRDHLPVSSGAINWRTALTEAQMLLGAHDVNARREAERQPAINSVWFWGEGQAPASVAARYDAVQAEDPFARGLAALSGARVVDQLSTIENRPGERVLVVLDRLDKALERTDLAAWQEAAAALEAEWFAEIGRLFARFGELRVILPRERDTLVATLKRPSFLQRFRSAKPLAAYG